jgi:hypothetical protein
MKSTKTYSVVRNGWGGLKWNVYASEWNAKSFVEASEWNKLLALVNKIQDKKPTMSKGTNILIDKNSEIPRPKLKEFIADNKLKKCTLASKANVIAIKRDTINFIKSLECVNVSFLSDADNQRIKTQPNQILYLDVHRDESNMDQEYFDVKNRCEIKQGYFLNNYRNKKQNESFEFLLSLMNTKATLVYDDVLMNEINSDGLDLDDDIFETVESMLLSKDTDTFNLGIEMLSNVNLQNNLFKISILMNSCFTSTSRLNALSYIKNNNFKALVAYLDSNKIRWNTRWEIYGMSMLKKFKDTPYERNITDYIIKQMNNHFKNVNKDDINELVNVVFK